MFYIRYYTNKSSQMLYWERQVAKNDLDTNEWIISLYDIKTKLTAGALNEDKQQQHSSSYFSCIV